ncbi:MAG: PqqD family protein [Clostridia bacterium]|nr:PqqD family protein [Clostridia bacterium]
MSKFRTRPGVVLTNICGEHILVAAKAAVPDCPFVTRINEESAFLWEKLKGGADEDELLRAVEKEFETDDPEALRGAIQAFLKQMSEMHLLVED